MRHFNLVPNQTKIFVHDLCISHFSAKIFIVYISAAVILEIFPFSLSYFHRNNTFVKRNVLVISKVIQGTASNPKNSQEENMTIRSNEFLLHESCIGFNTSMKMFVLGSVKGYYFTTTALIIIKTTSF